MWIKSQDEKRMANIDTCNLIAIVGSQGISQNITIDGMVIGTYSTEEKAIKVLNMICDFCFRCNGIFEMPLDSEV